MQTKPLLFGLIGFFIGGLLVSVAATTFDKPLTESDEMTMSEMVNELRNKTGDAYDRAFIEAMIAHHQAAIDMAKLSTTNAEHIEIKTLSKAVIDAQGKEISDMKLWQRQWGYESAGTHKSMNH